MSEFSKGASILFYEFLDFRWAGQRQKELRTAPVQRFGNLLIRGLQGLSGLCWSEIAAPGLSGLGDLQAGSLGALWVETDTRRIV